MSVIIWIEPTLRPIIGVQVRRQTRLSPIVVDNRTTRVSGSLPMASRPVLFTRVRLFHREVNPLSAQLVRCSVRITFDSEGVASGLSHQPLSGGKDLVSSSVPSPQRSILGVERCPLFSPDERHSVFTLLAEDRRSGPSHLLLRFYCSTAVAGPGLFSPTLGCSFSAKHITTSARPPAATTANVPSDSPCRGDSRPNQGAGRGTRLHPPGSEVSPRQATTTSADR